MTNNLLDCQLARSHCVQLLAQGSISQTLSSENSEDLEETTCLELRISGGVQEISETVEQFAWLSATLRPGGDRLSCSQVSITWIPTEQSDEDVDDDDVYVQMNLEPLRYDKIDSPGTCWVPLFDRSVLAWGFPIAQRGDALGLELSLDLMLRASGTRYLTDYEDAMIVSRDWITIYPYQAVEDVENAFQWHAVNGPPEEFFNETKIAPVLPLLKLGTLSEALAGRIFVGWVGKSKINLATNVPKEEGSGVDYERHRGLAIGNQMNINLNVGIRPP